MDDWGSTMARVLGTWAALSAVVSLVLARCLDRADARPVRAAVALVDDAADVIAS
jgi:hypothetical protein